MTRQEPAGATIAAADSPTSARSPRLFSTATARPECLLRAWEQLPTMWTGTS